ncbi:hypothetical protein [Brevibacterium aurantiacum]|nr:hypothetical protein [Brevibacterium aurantiacum]
MFTTVSRIFTPNPGRASAAAGKPERRPARSSSGITDEKDGPP